MSDIKGLFFKDQLLGARGLGAFGAAALSDGILNGCEVTISGSTATISPGHIIIGGRVIRIANAIEVGSIGAAFTSITATVDLTKTSTKSLFQQVTLGIVTGDTLDDVLTEDTNDINLSATTHTSWLWAHDATGAMEDSYHYAASQGKQLLWQNLTSGGASAVGDGFAAQALVIPRLNEFSSIEVLFRAEVDAVTSATYSCIIPDTVFLETESSGTFAGKKYLYWLPSIVRLSSGMRMIYERGLRIFPTENTIDITTGWRSRGDGYSTGSSANYMIPVEIYGVR